MACIVYQEGLLNTNYINKRRRSGSRGSEADRLISHPSLVAVVSHPQKRVIYAGAKNDRKMAALAPIQKC